MKPRIVITLGDPAGIGPEIVAAALRDPKILACCEPIVIGDVVAFKLHKESLPKAEMLATQGLTPKLALGKPSREAGESAIESLNLALGLLKARQAQALVTAPISKESLHLAKAGHPGHTEWLSHHAEARPVAMLMVAGRMRAVLMTRHVPLADVRRHLTGDTVEESAVLASAFAKDILGIARPKLMACGVNPHAGNGGLIGTEERDVIQPALRALERRGIRVDGPQPADSVFRDMADGRYDIVLAAYHDQAMIPLKLYAPEQLVNVTLGLPFIRTSPGHGTAYDIAGKGRANPASLKEAIRLAAEYAQCAAPR
jgi:4-hydroxythreonine-4-phosphate dehydrogenase